jgi:Ion channel
VTFDTIAAASCAYVVFGAIWADVYFLVALGVPGSFEIPATLLSGAGALRSALLYFSFETLTTIAYGDIHPMTVGAGGLAVSEAIVGQLYLAIMITRLVALQLAGRGDPRSSPEK